MAKAHIVDFDDLYDFEFDGINLRVSAGVTITRTGSSIYVQGTDGDDVIFGGDDFLFVDGAGGNDYIRTGNGGGQFSGGFDQNDGDIIDVASSPGIVRLDCGPDGYYNTKIADTISIVHQASPQGYQGHEMTINRIDPGRDFIDLAGIDGENYKFTSVIKGDRHINPDGSQDIEVLGAHLIGLTGKTEVFVRFDPNIAPVTYHNEDGTSTSGQAGLHELFDGILI